MLMKNYYMIDGAKNHIIIKKILNVYGPLAEYLNLNSLKKKIEENAFKEDKPEESTSGWGDK